MAQPITIHTDGACSGNPGPGGFAAIIQIQSGQQLTVSGGDPHTTNNRMELSAVIEALEAIATVPTWQNAQITVHSDSQYVVKAFNEDWISGWIKNGWRTTKGLVKNPDPWMRLLDLVRDRDVTYVWVKGHSGDPMNEACDQLAVEQALFARTQPEYWTSAGNPKSRATSSPPASVLAPVQDEPVRNNPVQNNPVQNNPVQNNPVQNNPVQNNPVQNNPVQHDPVQHDPVQHDPVQNNPVLPALQGTGPEKGPDYHAGYADGYNRDSQLAHQNGYETCRQELALFLNTLKPETPPSFADHMVTLVHSDGFHDCRRQLLEFHARMSPNTDLPF